MGARQPRTEGAAEQRCPVGGDPIGTAPPRATRALEPAACLGYANFMARRRLRKRPPRTTPVWWLILMAGIALALIFYIKFRSASLTEAPPPAPTPPAPQSNSDVELAPSPARE